MEQPSEALLEEWRKEQNRLKQNIITYDKDLGFDANYTRSIVLKNKTKSIPSGLRCTYLDPIPADYEISTPFLGNITKDMILKEKLKYKNKMLRYVGGVDISFVKGTQKAVSSIAVLELPTFNVVYKSMKVVTLTKPYVSGFLAFREVDHLVDLIKELRATKPKLEPQVILVDGSGIHHHQFFGLACHFGVLVNIPTIGIMKNFLCIDDLKMEYLKELKEPLLKGGDYAPIYGSSCTLLSAAYRCTDKSKTPVFVSIGHRISLLTALNVVSLVSFFKIPEPIRAADLQSREFVRQMNH